MPLFKYEMQGTAAGGQTWQTFGTVEAAALMAAPNEALRESFNRLTAGRAVYGQPGAGCRGPYNITKLVIEACDEQGT